MFDVVYDPGTGLATWTNITYDLGDQPINDAVLDTDTGNIFVSTDFAVLLLEKGRRRGCRPRTACRPRPCPG